MNAKTVPTALERLKESAELVKNTAQTMIMKENVRNATMNTPSSLDNADTIVCWDVKLNSQIILAVNASSLLFLKISTVSFLTANLSMIMDVMPVSADSSSQTKELARKCPAVVLKHTEEFVLNVFLITN